MYFADVVRLKQFYASPQGRMVNALLWKRLHAFWPAASGEAILGLGFAVPYLTGEEANQVAVCMPAEQGALYWPAGAPNRVMLAHEAMLPFKDESFNRALVMHALEHSHHLPALLQELRRVLTPGGRIVAVVPNRLGIWARSHESPFGDGQPFSLWQMKQALGEGGFTFLRCASSLFVPPSRWRWLLRVAPLAEYTGQLLTPHLGGVLVVEAEKQVYAAIHEPVRARLAVPIPAGAYPAAPIASNTIEGVSTWGSTRGSPLAGK